MVRQPAHFRVGLFVLIGALIFVGVAIWLGASKYFEEYALYVSYFNESVSGLERDSSVKYLGVDAGRVDSIRIAPDGRLVEVILKIDPRIKLEPDMRAQIETAGITGIRFVEIIRKPEREPDRSPALTFESPYPVIKSRPSTITTILDNLNALYEKFMGVDLQGLSDQLRQVLETVGGLASSAEGLLASERVGRSLKNLERTTENLEEVSVIMPDLAKRLDRILDEKRFTGTIQSISDSVAEIRGFVSELRTEVKEMNLAERIHQTSQKLDLFLDEKRMERTLHTISEAAEEAKKLLGRVNTEADQLNLGKRIDETTLKVDTLISESKDLVGSLQTELLLLMEILRTTTENLRQTSQTFRDLSDTLSIQPSQLFFGRPPEPRISGGEE